MIRRYFALLVLGSVLPCTIASNPAVAAFTAEDIRRAKKATAMVDVAPPFNLRSFSTAFCIHPSGIFVTDAKSAKRAGHDGLRLVLDAGEEKPRVFAARVIRSDPDADLAILKVEKPETFTALELGKSDEVFETMELAVFGFRSDPGREPPKDMHPAFDVSVRRVTMLRRKQGETQHIELDASLSQGTAGGPLLNQQGRVVAILQSSSSMALAVPASKLENLLGQPEITVSVPEVSETNRHEPQEIAVQVACLASPRPDYTVELTLSSGADARTMMEKPEGGDTVKFRVVPVPRRQGPKRLLLSARFSGGSVDGRVLDQAVTIAGHALRLSEICRVRGGETPAATLVSGQEIGGPLRGAEKLAVDLGAAEATVDLGQALDASLENLDKPANSVSYKVVVKAGGRILNQTSGSMQVIGSAVSLPGPVRLEAERAVVRRLPACTSDVVPGGGGRFLLFSLPTLRKLAVFDVSRAEITRYLPLESDKVLFAANADKLLVVVPDRGVIERYDLLTLEKELAAPLPETGAIQAIAAGYASTGPVLLTTSSGPRLVDPATLALRRLNRKPIRVDSSGRKSTNLDISGDRLRASADGTAFACVSMNYPYGICFATLQGDDLQVVQGPEGNDLLLPGYDGSLLFARRGVFSAGMKPLQTDPSHDSMYFPTYHPAYFAGCTKLDPKGTRLSVYSTSDNGLLVSFTDLDELDDLRVPSPVLLVDRRFHFFPTANLLLTIPASRDQFVLRHLNVIESLQKAGVSYLIVASVPPAQVRAGAEYVYSVRVQSAKGGVRYALIVGPQGMSISPEGIVRWKAPQDQHGGRVSVKIAVRDATGQEVFHSFAIDVL